MAKRVISTAALLLGSLIALLGLIVCMCETPDFDKQVINILCGFGIMITGMVMVCWGKEGSGMLDD